LVERQRRVCWSRLMEQAAKGNKLSTFMLACLADLELSAQG
jgi:hypothetical protein